MRRTITFRLNNQEYTLEIEDYETLVEVLRERLDFTGTKEGCGEGECGACTLIVNGRAVTSCLILAAEADGAEIETIEGQAIGERLSAIQKAFIDEGAVQCGFCTSGMIMSTKALLSRNPDPTDEEIKEALAGNLCRCTGYFKILQAVRTAAERLKAGSRQEAKSI